MDLVGEIIEKDTVEPSAPVIPQHVDLKKIQQLKKKRESSFLNRRNGRTPAGRDAPKREPIKVESKVEPKEPKTVKPDEGLSEAEKIHQENMERISSMTEEEIEQERKELMQQLDPRLVKSLINRAEKRVKDEHHDHQHAEGYEGWIGGMKTDDGVKELSHLDKSDIDKALGISELSITDKKVEIERGTGKEAEKDVKVPRDASGKTVRFDDVATVRFEDLPDDVEIDESGWEDVEDINDLAPHQEIAHKDYQLINEEMDDVHFPKPANKSQEYGHDLDINDPEFYDKLHEKFYPDLPKETNKLAWMTNPLPQKTTTTYDSISDMRFDFQGNLVELDRSSDSDVPTYLGLHHHSDNPHLPGYTLGELVHLSRSVMAGQRCLSIQMLGRILHKLGLHKYNIIPVDEGEENKEFNEGVQQVTRHFEKMMWDLIDELRVVESIQQAADEKVTRNLSVRNYAIEALWLWKQGGGRNSEEREGEEIENFV